MKTNQLTVLLSLLAISACGNGGGGGKNNLTDPSINQPEEMVEATPGTYYSVLRPVNFQSNGFIPYGAATFTLNGDQLQVSTSLDDDQAVTHRQGLHQGSRCPTLADDTNGDGYVDYNEALTVVGEAVLPLDADLSSRSAGAESYLKGPGMTYTKSASFSKINSEFAPGAGIGFQNRVVLVHGTAPQSSFPLSLASFAGEPAHLSLPIVCGVLEKTE